MKNYLKKLSLTARTIKMSLAIVIPILFIGSITVLLNSFPLQAYQDFMDSFLGGALRNILLTIQMTTVGILAIHITVALNFSYMSQVDPEGRLVYRFGSLLGCMTGFFMLVGFFSGEQDLSLLSGQGVFSAMVAGIVGSYLFKRFEEYFKSPRMVFVDGADSEFNAALHMVLPYLFVSLFFATVNYLITLIFGVQSIQHLFMKAMDTLFFRMHRSYASGLLFTSLTSIMWWFGIHGNNVLNQVAEDLFMTIIPGEIVSKSFIDTFVNMGGTGCTIGLLFAMIFFGKRSSTKRLSGMAILPGIFNISELMVFGFPVIYNPLMALPFLLAPVLCYTNAFLLTKIGFLPAVTTNVIWTTPPLMSGYLATGSVRGILVQLINIAISVGCYAPFVVMFEKRSLNDLSFSMNELMDVFKKSSDSREEITLTESEGIASKLAKHLAMDLESILTAAEKVSDPGERPLRVNYQPQFDAEGSVKGAEALARWEHKLCGPVYPPLLFKIARESGDLFRLESRIIDIAVSESASFRECFGSDFVLSVNVTLKTLYNRRFLPFLQETADRYRLRGGNVCIEIREESDLFASEKTSELIEQIRSFGYLVALDDFNMGRISAQYLQHTPFDFVKLDGELVSTVTDSEASREIIASIVRLSESRGFKVIAKHVETAEQKSALESLGCEIFQGYYYSPAVGSDSLKSRS